MILAFLLKPEFQRKLIFDFTFAIRGKLRGATYAKLRSYNRESCKFSEHSKHKHWFIASINQLNILIPRLPAHFRINSGNARTMADSLNLVYFANMKERRRQAQGDILNTTHKAEMSG